MKVLIFLSLIGFTTSNNIIKIPSICQGMDRCICVDPYGPFPHTIGIPRSMTSTHVTNGDFVGACTTHCQEICGHEKCVEEPDSRGFVKLVCLEDNPQLETAHLKKDL